LLFLPFLLFLSVFLFNGLVIVSSEVSFDIPGRADTATDPMPLQSLIFCGERLCTFTEIVRNWKNHTASTYKLVSSANPQLVQISIRKEDPRPARSPRLPPRRFTILLAVVMNAVTVAEPARLERAPVMENPRLLYIMAADEGKRNAAEDPAMTATLQMMLMM
jgi:hypothetical protein